MRAADFLDFQRVQPFEPFVIHVPDGRSFVIRHPDAASVSLNGKSISVLNAERMLEVIDMLLIVSVRRIKPLKSKQKR